MRIAKADELLPPPKVLRERQSKAGGAARSLCRSLRCLGHDGRANDRAASRVLVPGSVMAAAGLKLDQAVDVREESELVGRLKSAL